LTFSAQLLSCTFLTNWDGRRRRFRRNGLIPTFSCMLKLNRMFTRKLKIGSKLCHFLTIRLIWRSIKESISSNHLSLRLWDNKWCRNKFNFKLL
jgi:hypothetical protein